MEYQAGNVTASVQSDQFLFLHGYMLPVFFATDQLHRPPRCAEIQPISQQDASATRLYRGLVLDTREKNEKDEKFVHSTKHRWTGSSPSTILGVIKLETLGYPMVKTTSLCVLSF